MSNRHLPAELLDHIIDLVYDSRDALKSCCLVSKSWIPRTRKHLFADIGFTNTVLRSWKKTFLVPSTSPACYTRVLLLMFPLAVAAADREEGGWISTFTHVERLEVIATFAVDSTHWQGFSLAPLHGFSPVVKSLHLLFYAVPSSQVFNLIYSFPLLDNLSLTSYDSWTGDNNAFDGPTTAVQSSISPSFTGTLKFNVSVHEGFVASRLLSLPGSLHFRRLYFRLNRGEAGVSPITTLLEGCRFTLEFLKVDCDLTDPPSIDLSKATRLKHIVFVCGFTSKWIAVTLQTITDDHRSFQQVSIMVSNMRYLSGFNSANPADVAQVVGETIYREWLELDNFLARLLESHSIRLEVLYDVPPWMDRTRASSFMEGLCPVLATRGMVQPTEG